MKAPSGTLIFEPATFRSESLFKGQLHYNAWKGSVQGFEVSIQKSLGLLRQAFM